MLNWLAVAARLAQINHAPRLIAICFAFGAGIAGCERKTSPTPPAPTAPTTAPVSSTATNPGNASTLPPDLNAQVRKLIDEARAKADNGKDAWGNEQRALVSFVHSLSQAQREELASRIGSSGTGPSVADTELAALNYHLFSKLLETGNQDAAVRLLSRKPSSGGCPLVVVLHQLAIDGKCDPGLDIFFQAYDLANQETQSELEGILRHDLCFYLSDKERAEWGLTPNPTFMPWARKWYEDNKRRLVPNFHVCISGDDSCEAPALLDVSLEIERLLGGRAGEIVRGDLNLSAMQDSRKPACVKSLDPAYGEEPQIQRALAAAPPHAMVRVVTIDAADWCEGWIRVEARVQIADRASIIWWRRPTSVRLLLGPGNHSVIILPDAPI